MALVWRSSTGTTAVTAGPLPNGGDYWITPPGVSLGTKDTPGPGFRLIYYGPKHGHRQVGSFDTLGQAKQRAERDYAAHPDYKVGKGDDYYIIETWGDAFDQPTKRDAIAAAKRIIKGGESGIRIPEAIRVYKNLYDGREYIYAAWTDPKDPDVLHETTNPKVMGAMRQFDKDYYQRKHAGEVRRSPRRSLRRSSRRSRRRR